MCNTFSLNGSLDVGWKEKVKRSNRFVICYVMHYLCIERKPKRQKAFVQYNSFIYLVNSACSTIWNWNFYKMFSVLWYSFALDIELSLGGLFSKNWLDGWMNIQNKKNYTIEGSGTKKKNRLCYICYCKKKYLWS